MAKQVTIKSSSSNYFIEKSGVSYHLGSNDTLSYSSISTGMGDVDNIRLLIDGTITEGSYGLDIGNTGSTGNHITIGKTGVIDAALDVVQLTGDKTVLVNRGTIIGYSAENSVGISSTGDDARIVNEGFIRADLAIEITGDGTRVINNGNIATYMSENAIWFDSQGGQENRLVNTGSIIGSGNAVVGGDGNEIVINRGHLDGDVELGSGDDILDMKSGTAGDVYLGNGDDKVIVRDMARFTEVFAGADDDILDFRDAISFNAQATISGGNDDDVYLISRDDLNLQELGGGGTDTVKSTVTYTLKAEFEKLTLIGSKGIDGNGNASANVLTGNGADNRLDGMAGMDRLNGGAGKDMLTGGADADVFVFERGTGKDTITDFANGSDTIDLSGYKGINSFDDLDGRIEQAGDDVLITLRDGDRIRIENFDAGNLSGSTHFDF